MPLRRPSHCRTNPIGENENEKEKSADLLGSEIKPAQEWALTPACRASRRWASRRWASRRRGVEALGEALGWAGLGWALGAGQAGRRGVEALGRLGVEALGVEALHWSLTTRRDGA
jgi:hypothetical protein